VPGWFGWENQGAGIALADLNGNARQDLIVFHVDNPGGENHGYYRIVFDLTERPAPVPPEEDPQCTDLRGEIDALTDEISSLHKELQSAAPGEKAAIVRQIRALRGQIAELRRRGMQLGCAL
jgi:hypothetical protein